MSLFDDSTERAIEEYERIRNQGEREAVVLIASIVISLCVGFGVVGKIAGWW